MTILKKLLLTTIVGLSIPFNASINAESIQQHQNIRPFIDNFNSALDTNSIDNIVKKNLRLVAYDGFSVHDFLKDYSDNPASHTINILLHENNTFAGFIAYRMVNQNKGHIDALAIENNFRNKKYGTTLLEHAIQKLHTAGAHSIEIYALIDNIPAQNLYRKIGFKEIGTINNSHTHLRYTCKN